MEVYQGIIVRSPNLQKVYCIDVCKFLLFSVYDVPAIPLGILETYTFSSRIHKPKLEHLAPNTDYPNDTGYTSISS